MTTSDQHSELGNDRALEQLLRRTIVTQVALDRLPAKYGNVLEWKYIEGRSVKEISARLNIGQEATQSLLARAKRAFGDVYSSIIDAMNDRANGLV